MSAPTWSPWRRKSRVRSSRSMSSTTRRSRRATSWCQDRSGAVPARGQPAPGADRGADRPAQGGAGGAGHGEGGPRCRHLEPHLCRRAAGALRRSGGEQQRAARRARQRQQRAAAHHGGDDDLADRHRQGADQHQRHQAALDVAKAEKATAEWKLSRTEVVAPADGSINNLTMRIGDTATVNIPMIGIVDAHAWRIIANYKQYYIRSFKIGGTAWVWLDSAPWKFHAPASPASPAASAAIRRRPCCCPTSRRPPTGSACSGASR